ncbi:MAG TPA: hypothetical protein VGG12_05625 [Methylovirgula sp.]|jgi:hypothetical protein
MLLKSITQKSFLSAATAAVLALQIAPALADGPFQKFVGTWRGDGRIAMRDGTKESIRCRVSYAVAGGGTLLSQSLVCASQSYKFNVESQVRADGNQLSGSWTETSRDVTGSVSGTVADGTIVGTVTGATFSAGLSLTVRGNSQFVQIKPSETTDVDNVTVTLHR